VIPADAPAWLYHDVPLWAFLLALLTSPWRWAGYAKRVIKQLNPWGGGGE
jgi:hypothetical protein